MIERITKNTYDISFIISRNNKSPRSRRRKTMRLWRRWKVGWGGSKIWRQRRSTWWWRSKVRRRRCTYQCRKNKLPRLDWYKITSSNSSISNQPWIRLTYLEGEGIEEGVAKIAQVVLVVGLAEGGLSSSLEGEDLCNICCKFY